MGGNKNNHTSSVNGSRLTEDTGQPSNNKSNIDEESYITIRINKSHLYGAGCALFGALLVIAVQRLLGIDGGPHDVQFHRTTGSASRGQSESLPKESSFTQVENEGKQDSLNSNVKDSSEFKIHTKEGRHPVRI